MASATLTKMSDAAGPQDWSAIQVQEWLLLLLRFAITRDPKDEAAALSVANDLDSLGMCFIRSNVLRQNKR